MEKTPNQTVLDEALGGFAYIRKLSVDDLGPEIDTPDGLETVFALHAADGRRLALFDNPDLAVQIAQSHSLQPVSLH